MNVGEIIGTYMKLRAKKKSIEAAAKSEVEKLTAVMDKIETLLKVEADKQGVTSFKSEHGTAFISTKDYANVADWDAVLGYIQTSGDYTILNKAVNKTAVRAYIDRTKETPPGVTYGTMLEINVRKPAANTDD